jgi:hypothetical protein
VDEKRFWDIIAVGCPREPAEGSWVDALTAQLVRLSVAEIDSFARVLDLKLRAACTFDLWATLSLIDQGDDLGFLHFANWLIGAGKPIYEAAVQNADSLAESIQPDEDLGADLTNITGMAWSEVTGRPHSDFRQGKDLLEGAFPEDMAGERWADNDPAELRRRLPRLAKRFLPSEEVTE